MQQTAVEWLVEEFKEKLTGNNLPNLVLDVIQQAQTMEKEQMYSFAEFVATYPDKNKNYLGEMLHAKSKYDGAERTVDLLETFKSK